MYSPLWRLGNMESPSTLKFCKATRTIRKIAIVRTAVSISSLIHERRLAMCPPDTLLSYYLVKLSIKRVGTGVNRDLRGFRARRSPRPPATTRERAAPKGAAPAALEGLLCARG